MTTTTKKPRAPRKPKAPPVRTARYRRISPTFGVLVLTVGEGPKAEVSEFFCERVDSPHGLTFQIEKFRSSQTEGEPTGYRVTIDVHEDQPSCQCDGWLYRGKCRHVSALTALHVAGKV